MKAKRQGIREHVFFAYESKGKSGSSINVDAILNAKNILNSSKQYRVITWEDLRNNGRILIKAIFDSIDNCDIFACDLTYLNHNVLFELGYAIAKNKKLFLLLNPTIQNAQTLYSSIDILEGIGYSPFNNSEDIINEINSIPQAPKLLDDLHIVDNGKKHNIFYIKSISNSQAELDIFAWLKSADYKMVYDDPNEIEYRSFKWYIESILESECVIVHITDSHITNATISNIKASLFAGISCGKDRRTMLLAPKSYKPPIDYSDILIKYADTNECTEKLKTWIAKHATNNKLPNDDKELNLLKLGLGYEIAENEKDELSNYFVETSAYSNAIKSKRVFFIGRKGTGKTALFIIISKEMRKRDNTYVVTLKPESTEMLYNIEVANLYKGVAQKSSFFHSIWKFVIYSKTIILVYEDIKKKNKKFWDKDSIEQRIIIFVEQNRIMLEQHFIETLNYVDKQSDINSLQKLHEQFVTPTQFLIKEYLKQNKYAEIVILADNLDRTWEINNDLSIQVDMLLCLFEVTGQIESALANSENTAVNLKVLLFLRQDIFDYMLRFAREPDKLTLYKQDIDWSNFPDKLNQLIEKRFKFSLELDENYDISKVWKEYFDIKQNSKPVFEKLRDVCLPRPRDILLFMKQMFESAVNNSHSQVLDSDFEYALKGYSEFLYQNLIAEMSAAYPNIRDVLDKLHRNYYDKIELEELIKLIDANGQSATLIDNLIRNGYFSIRNLETGKIYEDCKSARESLDQSYTKLLWFKIKPPKAQIFAILTPQYIGRGNLGASHSTAHNKKRSIFYRIILNK